jgi:poly-gamma-glutamate synthesis protein (capsule biosynthesis protein)
MKRAAAVVCLAACWAVVGLQLTLFARASGTDGPSPRPEAEAEKTAGPPTRGASPISDRGDLLALRDRERPTTVAVVGDVHGEPPIAAALARGANPLQGMARPLRAADYALANVETAVAQSGVPAPKTFTFRASPALWGALRRAGVDVVSLANNHALDYGPGALLEGIAGARAAGLRVVGAGRDARAAYRPVVLGRRGRRVAFVGLTRVLPTLAWAAGRDRPGLASAYDEDAALRAVRAAARRADRVVVSVHWGQELHPCPDAVQRALAGRLVAAGADVVAGHHPHVLQGVERPGRALVGYSLGNFVFYARDERTRATGVLTARLDARGVVGHSFDPARIDSAGAPQPLRGAERDRRVAGLRALRPGGGSCD